MKNYPKIYKRYKCTACGHKCSIKNDFNPAECILKKRGSESVNDIIPNWKLK